LNSLDVDSFPSSNTLTNKSKRARVELETLFENENVCAGFKPLTDLWVDFPFQLLGTKFLPPMVLNNDALHSITRFAPLTISNQLV